MDTWLNATRSRRTTWRRCGRPSRRCSSGRKPCGGAIGVPTIRRAVPGTNSPQPRLSNTEIFIDAETASAVEFWVSEPIRGLAAELLRDEHTGVSAMQMMCNPTYDYGPASWHRDIHPIDMGPMQQMQDSLVEDGPSYVQWNIPAVRRQRVLGRAGQPHADQQRGRKPQPGAR